MSHHHHDEVLASVEEAIENPELLKYWRSPDQRLRTKAYVESVQDEFAEGASEITGFQRREMLKLMGASFALAGVSVACRRPVEKILPYVKPPREVIPGVPNYFATAMQTPYGGVGLLVESHEGRPTKIEGNPEHPETKGRADSHMQASVLELYDPDRSRSPMNKAKVGRQMATWADWDGFATPYFKGFEASGGTGLAFLTGGDDSPTFVRLVQAVQKRFPNARWFAHDLLRSQAVYDGAALAFGEGARVHYQFEQAKTIFAVQADPLMTGPEHLKHARGFANGRRIYDAKDAKKMNRLYVAESGYSVTGTNADHRYQLAMADTADFLRAVGYELLVTQGLMPSLGDAAGQAKLLGQLKTDKIFDKRFVKAVARDLVQNKGQALIVVGEYADDATQALGHLLNVALGGVGKTVGVSYAKIPLPPLGKGENTVAALAKSLAAGQVKGLVILDANPLFMAPGGLKFSEAMAKAETVIHAGLFQDETGEVANWHLPTAHFLESWNDARSFDGTISIGQPLIAPLHNGRSIHELLSQIAGQPGKKSFDLVQETWRSNMGLLASDKSWRKAIHDGFVEGSSYSTTGAKVALSATADGLATQKRTATPSKDNLEVVFANDYSVADGRYANLGWIQELPDPVTKIAWDNAILISPKLASALGVTSQVVKRNYQADLVEVAANGQSIKIPAFVMPGLPDYSTVVHLGYGRKAAGYVGNGIGVDVYPIMPVDGSRFTGATIKSVGRTATLCTTQSQFAVNGDAIKEGMTLTLQNRAPSRDGDVGAFEKDPESIRKKGLLTEELMREEAGSDKPQPMQLTKPWQYNGNKWGMVIDLTSCIGCNACVAACVSENNIPVVGRDQVVRGRLMHWIRVDRYYTGDVSNPQTVHQPVPCMHCENAPCEPVCPVAATSHDHEGLNAMTYNRCVGTRYCANNCPYKVRRFNYFDYSNSGNLYVDETSLGRQKLLKLQANPDVTVRYRGVMEKCTYCTQRIQEAKISARRNKTDPNDLADGAVTPACAQSCPTDAITFGNLNDKNSRVTKLKNGGRNYDLLEELNTRPRTSYLSKLRNPNPELE